MVFPEPGQKRPANAGQKKAWQVHADVLRKLASNSYEDCICDVVGLDDNFQILEGLQSDIGYLHRPDCLAYPNAEIGYGAASTQLTFHCFVNSEKLHAAKMVGKSLHERRDMSSRVNSDCTTHVRALT